MCERTKRGGNYAAELQGPEVYRERRRRLAEAVKQGTIVVWGGGDDRTYGDSGTFCQGSNFFYLTGVELPNAALVLRPHDEDDYEALFLPSRKEPQELWTGPKWGPGEEAAEALGFAKVLATEATEKIIQSRRRPVPGLEGRLQGWLKEDDAVLLTPLSATANSAPLPATQRFISLLHERLPTFAVRDLSKQLRDLRIIKDAGEVALMRSAVAATIHGHRQVARVIGPGVSEGAVDGAAYAGFREKGAERLAFSSIVGSGRNGTVLHYDRNIGVCQDGELVVVDIGARYGYYCGDLTRTYPVNGKFSKRQRAIYDLVLATHDRVAAAIKPGKTVFELRGLAYENFESSDLRDSEGEPLNRHFIHGLGHYLGLDCHDCGSDEGELKAGMIITVEPGLYLQDEAIGVRIENNFLVTEDGAENLSADLPTAAEEIEAMMQDPAKPKRR